MSVDWTCTSTALVLVLAVLGLAGWLWGRRDS